ncbi:MAG TPA: helix-turn-helix domain-containing protein [Chitinophagaceae bacterium]|nr:helix-turn-helix domain-containing protein [Chitinophagaceae bacterium]
MEYDLNNEMFRLAAELVNQSSRNIFLTGKAGTGKTTFLKYIRENCPKQIAVVAPTGVAAINAGGVTMHSFFQLPFSPFIPDVGGFNKQTGETTDKNSLLSKLRMTTEKKKTLQELELLIIDEISMVRCDMLDAVDTVLRHIRRRNYERFGGVQVLFIGDMFQLPPVIKEHEWRLLKDFYSSPYFFDSLVIKEEQPVYIEFDKIYRQSEEKFINVLNQVRNNQLDDDGRNLLEKRFAPDFRRTKNDGYIILTTHNERARNKNETELNSLANKSFSYRADIEGDFPESAYPVEEQLLLKVGSQVMFIKNDTERIKRYFNGKIGIVTELDNDKILIQCKDESETIEVKKEKWENIRYTVDKKNRQLSEEVLGSFTQYPLRLAWAITIHKSQGLTFDKVIIDAGEAFAPGQVYVALSRCTTLDGIVLQSHIRSNRMFSDERIVRFSKTNSSKNILELELQRSKRSYQLKILLSLFDYKQIFEDAKELNQYLSENRSSFNEESEKWLDEFLNEIIKVDGTAEKFQNQLRSIFNREENAGTNELLKERMSAGAIYFLEEQKKLRELLIGCPILTDSRLHAKEINEALKEIFSGLSIKKYLMEGLSGVFDIETYHKRKKDFTLPAFSVNVYAGEAKERTESPHPVLHQRLRKLRDNICSKADLPIYIIAGTNTLDEMSRYLPQTLVEIRKISGFGDAKTEKYGQQFLNIILEYCGEKNLSSLIHEKNPKKEKKTESGEKKKKIDTKAESFRLYKEGKRVDEIAKERNLTQQTIEGHLAHYVSIGEIDIEELVSKEKISLIEPHTKEFKGGSITTIKEKLGSKISFGEIRLVLASYTFKKGSSSGNDL